MTNNSLNMSDKIQFINNKLCVPDEPIIPFIEEMASGKILLNLVSEWLMLLWKLLMVPEKDRLEEVLAGKSFWKARNISTGRNFKHFKIIWLE